MLQISKFQHHAQHHAKMQGKRRIPIFPVHKIYEPETSPYTLYESNYVRKVGQKIRLHVTRVFRNGVYTSVTYEGMTTCNKPNIVSSNIMCTVESCHTIWD